MPIKNIFVLAVIIVVFGFIQFAGIEIFGVKPNFILAGLIAVIFFVSDIWQRIFLAVLASLLFKFSPEISNETIVFFMVGILAAIAANNLPARPFTGTLVLTAAGTLLIYLFLFATAIGSAVFLKELAYNLIFSSVVYYFLSLTNLKNKL